MTTSNEIRPRKEAEVPSIVNSLFSFGRNTESTSHHFHP